jgi:molybdopterin converting factor small subunit
MRIHLDFKGVPILYKTLNKQKEIDVDWTPAAGTVKELVNFLARQFGASVKKALLDASGNIDQEIRVVLNQSTYLMDNRMETVLKDGDTLAFLGAS